MDETQDITLLIVVTTTLLALLTVVIINLLLVSRNKRLKHNNELLQVHSDYRNELMKTQVEVLETTLNELSQQLHDDVGQMITFSIVQLNNIKTEDVHLQQEIQKVRESVQGSMQSLRDVSKTLSTDYISSFGMLESLNKLIERVRKASLLTIETDFKNSISLESRSNEIFAFRIIQELITNTLKHAEATRIRLSIVRNESDVIIEYTDNGRGLREASLSSLSDKNGMGFTNIMKRVNLMKGKMTVENLNPGFKFVLTFPNHPL